VVEVTYAVTAEPDGRFWVVRIPAINRVTQARNVKEIDVMAVDLIEIMTGETGAAIHVEFVLPESVRAHLHKVDEARAQEEIARKVAALELREAARDLRGRRLSYVDVGAVLGVSHQRAHQLVND
jgi:hypothetical protein